MINQSSIEQLRNQLDVIDVISNYIELKKSGANYKAPCPFHDEKSPSFVVSPSKQIYHCFGCGAGGDAIKFVMEYEKLNYPEAIEKLASQYNFTLTYDKNYKPKVDVKLIEKLHEWYQTHLVHHQEAQKYLHDRGVHEFSIERFGIGYAPNSSDTLRFIGQDNLKHALELGLIGYDGGRYFARFIERVLFPIHAQNGALVGFGGRTITGHQAKYVNSPQSAVFDKSKLLYAYHLARDTIYKTKQMIVTEGYLDVVMLHQAGFTNAVATLGTALTQSHIPLLKKGDPEIIMAYDGDSAGKNAALKAAKLLSGVGINGGVVLFDEGQDPADMVKNKHINELNSLFGTPTKLPLFVLQTTISQYDIKDPSQKERALHECVAYLKSLTPIFQETYKPMLAAMLNVSTGLIRLTPQAQKNSQSIAQSVVHDRDVWELALIKSMLNNPILIDTVIEFIDAGMLRRHGLEFSLVLQKNSEHVAVRNIMMDESIMPFKNEDIQNEIRTFLIKYYTNKLNNKSSLTMKEIRIIKEKITQLKNGLLA